MNLTNMIFKKLANNKKKASEKERLESKTPKWTCDFCGEENFNYDFNCQNCGHERED